MNFFINLNIVTNLCISNWCHIKYKFSELASHAIVWKQVVLRSFRWDLFYITIFIHLTFRQCEIQKVKIQLEHNQNKQSWTEKGFLNSQMNLWAFVFFNKCSDSHLPPSECFTLLLISLTSTSISLGWMLISCPLISSHTEQSISH